MKDSIFETMTVEGFARNMHREVVKICGVFFKFYDPGPAEYEKGKTTLLVVSTNPCEFSVSKGRVLRKKVRQYLQYIAHKNQEGIQVSRRKWY